MPGLQVLSAPLNQPTLNPKVQNAPVQPTIAPRVVTTPQRPVLAPKVITQPQQPTLTPQVQSQPQGQQASLPVSYGKVIDSIVAAKGRGADPQTILQAIITQNQDKAPMFQEALKRGASPEQILDKIIQDNYIKSESPSPQGEHGLKGVALGVAKGAFGTLKNLTKVAAYVTPGGSSLAPYVSKTLDSVLPKENLEAHGTAETIGKLGENIAEFFIPAGIVSKVGKATEAGIETLQLGTKAASLLKVGAKSAIGAAEAGGITALQGGEKNDTKTAAILGAALPIVGRVLDSIIQKVPETAWTSILKRTTTDAAKNPNLPKQAAQTGLTGLTRQAIANKAETAIQTIETSLDDLLSNSKGKISTAKVAGYLNGIRGAYATIPGEESSVKVIDSIASQLLEGFKKGESMTPLEANQLKRDIYQVIAKSYGRGTFEIPAKTEAQKLVAAGLKKEIESVIPEARSLNQKQAVYIQIKKALDKTIARTEGKGIAGTGVGLYDLLIGGIGTGAGAMTGNPLLGLGLVATKKTAESPLVLSSTAKLLNYFNTLSPTKKLLFYQAIKGLTIKGGLETKKAVSP